MRNVFVAATGAGLLLVGATFAFAAELIPKGVFTIRNRKVVEESRGKVKEWVLVELLPLSKSRFLALAEVLAYKKPHSERKKPDPDSPVVKEGLPQILEEGHVLAIVTKEGKVIAESPLVPHLRGGGGVPGAPQRTRALAMEENPDCPYAMLRVDREELWCFDYQLAKGAVYPVPLGAIEGAVPVVTSAGFEVWIFGQERTAEASPVTPSLWTELTRAPRIPHTLGLGLRTDTGELHELAVGGEKLAAALRQAAQSWLGARKGWRLSGLRLRPGSATEPVHAANGVPVLVQALFQGLGEGGESATSWLFFDGRLGEAGLLSLRQVSFSVVPESGIKKARLNLKEMVLRVPEASSLHSFSRIPLAAQNFLLGLTVVSAPEGKEVAEAQGYDARFFTFLVTPSGVEVLPSSKFQDLASDKLSTSDTWVWVFPMFIRGFGPSGDLLMDAECRSRRTEERTHPCAVWAEVRP